MPLHTWKKVSPKTLINIRNDNKQIFEGLIYLPPESKDNSFPKSILWSDESIKILIKELPTIAKEWKDSIKEEFMEKGIVIAETDNRLLLIEYN